MNIKGIQKTTLIDYPRQVASTIFLGGCNMRCGYCHNGTLVRNEGESIPVLEVMRLLKQRQPVINHICITGGEPTVTKDLPVFIQMLKKEGFKVKLDTNGTNPAMLKELIDKDMLDYVSVDIKTSRAKYERLVGNVDLSLIDETIKLLKKGKVPYEWRITVVPGFAEHDDLRNVGAWVNDENGKMFIQNFGPQNELLDKEFEKLKPFSDDELLGMKYVMHNYFKEVKIRG